jgi:hypothetical protein
VSSVKKFGDLLHLISLNANFIQRFTSGNASRIRGSV